MAHKGRLWEVAQFARMWSGQVHWPDYPPKIWVMDCENWQGSAMHPSQITDIECELQPVVNHNEAIWLSEDLGPAGQVTIVGLKLTIPGGASEHVEIRPLCFVDGDDQYEPLWAWAEPTTYSLFGFATDAGVMKTGWILKPNFIVHYVAKPY